MKAIPLHIGYEHDCDYLPGNRATMAYVSPRVPLDKSVYTQLVANGFRRSGDLVYRPYCEGCSACLPVRIPAERFTPNRAQRRVLKMNADLRVVAKPGEFDEAHYQLYRRYLQSRHGDGSMASSSPAEYLQFLGSRWGEVGFYEFLDGDQLLAVAVIDHLEDGLSAVYTFYDPEAMHRGLGTYAVLWQIGEARRRGLPWVYLGFWISACRKMAYKGNFRPLQVLVGSRWMAVGKGENVTA
jgi:arginyl-tRNA--protein-N-Asp/Glu arginylyltransferase